MDGEVGSTPSEPGEFYLVPSELIDKDGVNVRNRHFCSDFLLLLGGGEPPAPLRDVLLGNDFEVWEKCCNFVDVNVYCFNIDFNLNNVLSYDTNAVDYIES